MSQATECFGCGNDEMELEECWSCGDMFCDGCRVLTDDGYFCTECEE